MARNVLSGLLVFLLLAATASLGGCSSKVAVTLANPETMPAPIQDAPRWVAEAYRFAAANPDVAKQIPCYCGCVVLDHESNYDCFWREEGYMDEHALGCGICVDIAQDTLRGLRQGRSLAEIRAQIDADYSRFGPSTNTPPAEMGGGGVPWDNGIG